MQLLLRRYAISLQSAGHQLTEVLLEKAHAVVERASFVRPLDVNALFLIEKFLDAPVLFGFVELQLADFG